MPKYFCDFHCTYHDDDTTPAVEIQPDVFVCELASDRYEPPATPLKITFGALAKPLKTQLGVNDATIQRLQKCVDAVTLLHLQDIISETQAHNMRKKLFVRIRKHMKP